MSERGATVAAAGGGCWLSGYQYFVWLLDGFYVLTRCFLKVDMLPQHYNYCIHNIYCCPGQFCILHYKYCCKCFPDTL